MKMNEVVNTAAMTVWISECVKFITMHVIQTTFPEDYPDGSLIVGYGIAGNPSNCVLVIY